MSNDLDTTPVSESQANFDVAVNDQVDEVVDSLTKSVAKNADSSNAVSVSEAELQRAGRIVVGEVASPAPTGDITVTVAAFRRGRFIVINNTNQTVIVQISGQSVTAPRIPAGLAGNLDSDGSDVRPLDGSSSRAYDLPFRSADTPADGVELDAHVMVRDVIIPANMSGSQGRVSANPDASYEISIKKNGGEIGTVTISTGGAFTFATSGGAAQSLEAGDVLTAVAPSPSPDESSLAGLSFTIKAREA